MKKYLITYRNI